METSGSSRLHLILILLQHDDEFAAMLLKQFEAELVRVVFENIVEER